MSQADSGEQPVQVADQPTPVHSGFAGLILGLRLIAGSQFAGLILGLIAIAVAFGFVALGAAVPNELFGRVVAVIAGIGLVVVGAIVARGGGNRWIRFGLAAVAIALAAAATANFFFTQPPHDQYVAWLTVATFAALI